MKIKPKLWLAYKQSYFFLNNWLDYKSFAVITACNPYSQRALDEVNKAKNKQLANDISEYKYCDILVGDEKKIWLEESFAVELPAIEAIQLVKKYHQNAIYFVRNGELYIISCRADQADQYIEKIGKFSDRVIIKN